MRYGPIRGHLKGKNQPKRPTKTILNILLIKLHIYPHNHLSQLVLVCYVPFNDSVSLPTMSNSNFFFFSPLFFFILIPFNSFALSCCPQTYNNNPPQFSQKTHHFWEFDQQSNTWVQLKLPHDLLSCVNNNCTRMGSIDPVSIESQSDDNSKKNGSVFALRKRVSLTKMSETSVWVTGESGSIYERFWNGIKWVIAPHDLPLSAGYAVSVFIVNHTILALSEAGFLYQVPIFFLASKHPS